MLVSNDERRKLYEFQYPVTKVVVMNEDNSVGDHFHKKKEELFVLLSGEGVAKINGLVKSMELFREYKVKKGIKHTFYLKKGSILLGFCSKEYDPTDDYEA